MENPFANLFESRQLRLIAIVFALLFGLLALAYYTFLRTDYVVLYNGLRPADASAVVAQLDAKGVGYRLRDGGSTILVAEGDADTARLQVAGSEATAKGLSGFELFNKSDMGLTDFAQKINYQRALQGELARTIMMMDGIADARVHLSLPDRSIFRSNRSEPKAAVALTMKSGAIADEASVAGIQRLVAAAVPDLELADVVVLDELGRVISYSAAPESAEPPDVEEQSAVQQYYRARARAAIEASAPGLKFDVRVVVLPQAAGSGTVAWDEAPGSTPATPPSRRGYTIRISVLTTRPLAPDEQQAIDNSVAASAGLDRANGDSVAFAVGPLTPVAPVSPVPEAALSSARSQPGAAHEERRDAGWSAMATGLAVLVIILVISGLAFMRGGALLPSDRAAFVLRIRRQLGLAAEDANG